MLLLLLSPASISAVLRGLRRAPRLLGRCPDNLQVGQALLRFSSYQTEAAGDSSPPSGEQGEGLGSFKVHMTPKLGGGCQLCLDTQLPDAADWSFSKM